MPEKLSEAQLTAIVSQQIELAKNHYSKGGRGTSNAKALDYFMGNMDAYVPPEANRSKVVSRDVADTIGYILPDIMRVFTASPNMAIAQPDTKADAEYAEQVTDGLNYVFWKDNKGYEIVYNATWDALLVGNGIVKTYYDPTPVYSVSFHDGLTEDQVAMLVEDDEVEVLAKDEEDAQVEFEGQYVTLKLYALKIRRKKLDGRFVIDVIPPEEFLIDGDAITTDDAAFTDHWQKKTRSHLVAMGYDKDEVWTIPEAARADTPEEQSRRLMVAAEATDESMEIVDYHECFVRVDVDGDGEAELVRACYGGGSKGTLLDWEVWEDEYPFDDIPCEPVPHRWDARSVADETIDIQDIKTVLTRQLLNNTYWVNNPQRFVQGKIRNPEALISPTFGEPVFGDVGSLVTDLPTAYIGDKALMALTHFDEVRQARTGVGRQQMALDPDVLQNQTAEASRNNRDAAHSQSELIARNMAEWGWTKVFRKLMKLMAKHQKQPRELMLDNKRTVVIDPRYWNADMKVAVNTGLGTGSRDRDLQMLQSVLQSQLMLADRFMAAGAIQDAIDMLPLIIQTMEMMAESAGIRNARDYYPEYTEDKVNQLKAMAAMPKPDPEVAKAQIDAQNKDAQSQRDHEYRMAQLSSKTELDKQAADNKLILDKYQTDGELALKRDQLIDELTLKRDLGYAQLSVDRELGHAGVVADASVKSATSSVHVGGEPG